MEGGVQLEIELVRIDARSVPSLARTELVDDVEVGREPTPHLVGVDQIQVELEFELHQIITDVVAAAQAGRDPRASGDQALIVQRIVDAIYLSATTGREQAIPPLEVPL